MIKIFIAAVLIGFYSIGANAGVIILLKHKQVNQPYLFLKDITRSRLSLKESKIIISSAPAIGKSIYLSAKTIETVLKRYRIYDKIIGNRIRIYRPAIKISPAYVKELLKKFMKNNNIAGNIEAISGPSILLDKKAYHMQININRDMYPAIANLTLNSDGYFRRISYRVYLKHLIKIPIAANYIKAGNRITESMIKYEKVNEYSMPLNIIRNAENIIGKKILSSIEGGLPFYKNRIDNNIVKRGETVTMLYEVKNLIIKRVGIAINSGAKGSVISVRVNSNKIIHGVVVGKDLIKPI